MSQAIAAGVAKTGATAKVLVVDDEERNRRLLVMMLEAEGYATMEAADGPSALQTALAQPPDLILLDLMMPGMDGYEVARRLKADPATHSVPIVIVTSLDDRESRLRGLEAGAEEFVTKPVDRSELRVRVRNLLRLKVLNDFLARHNEILEQQVAERTRQLRDSQLETIFALSRAAEHKDEDIGTHVQRISCYTSELSLQLGLGKEFAERMFYASPMHDIGKIGVPDYVLLKPGHYDSIEWGIMKQHCKLGWEILNRGTTPYVKLGAEIALNHHERWDGGGYPSGLKDQAIPLPARIMQLCDVYDALRSKRPYKPAFSHATGVEIMSRGDLRTQPEHFDPAVLDAFGRSAARFAEIFDAIPD